MFLVHNRNKLCFFEQIQCTAYVSRGEPWLAVSNSTRIDHFVNGESSTLLQHGIEHQLPVAVERLLFRLQEVTELSFQINFRPDYGALVRLMIGRYVEKKVTPELKSFSQGLEPSDEVEVPPAIS